MSSSVIDSASSGLPTAKWMMERAQYAARELDDCVDVNPQILGGVPVLKGTRVPVAQVLAEIGEGQTAQQVAADFHLDAAQVKRLVLGLAACLDQPAMK